MGKKKDASSVRLGPRRRRDICSHEQIGKPCSHGKKIAATNHDAFGVLRTRTYLPSSRQGIRPERSSSGREARASSASILAPSHFSSSTAPSSAATAIAADLTLVRQLASPFGCHAVESSCGPGSGTPRRQAHHREVFSSVPPAYCCDARDISKFHCHGRHSQSQVDSCAGRCWLDDGLAGSSITSSKRYAAEPP